jgi:hypothetical protein
VSVPLCAVKSCGLAAVSLTVANCTLTVWNGAVGVLTVSTAFTDPPTPSVTDTSEIENAGGDSALSTTSLPSPPM